MPARHYRNALSPMASARACGSELAKVSGRKKRTNDLVHRRRQGDDGFDIKRHFVGCIGRIGQTREFTNRVQNADAETRVGLVERSAIIADDARAFEGAPCRHPWRWARVFFQFG